MPGLRAVLAADPVVCRDRLIAFRSGLYRCFGKRTDALFDLVDAVLTAQSGVLAGGAVAGEGVPARARRVV